MTPFHCAAINPNTKYLKELLAAKPEDRLADTIKRQPIHYAAACTGSGPLKLLLDRGVSHREVDREGSTPLMIAAQCGRLDSIKLLLDWDSRKMAEAEKEAEESDKEHSSDDGDEVPKHLIQFWLYLLFN
jgi:ankyrin repeat protein